MNLLNKIQCPDWKYHICIVLFLMISHSCNKVELFPSYIQRFLIDPTEIKAYVNSNGTFYVSAKFNKECSYASEGEDKRIYDKLCKKYHDTAYYLIEDIHDRNVSTIFPKVSLISITSSKDFDNKHPAGSLLNDIIQMNYTELQQFIDNTYNPEYLEVKHMILSEFDYTQELIQYGTDNFEFIKPPLITGQHKLTISIRFGDKNTLSTNFRYDFE